MEHLAELVLDAKARLGESACWHAEGGILYWVDIAGQALHAFDPTTGEDRAVNVGQMIGAVAPRRSGGLVAALHHGLAELDPDSGETRLIADPEADLPDNRFNDGKCDPAGRFWAGSLNLQRRPGAANLWRLDADGTVTRMLQGVTNSNGLVWSLDEETLYYIDTGTRRIDAFDYSVHSGEIVNRRPVVEVPEAMGKPDGMTIDFEGMLWVALYRGGCVTRWDPRNGKLLARIAVPATQTTTCAFGGADLGDLYITTARQNLDDEVLQEQPHAGGVFRARPGVAGPAPFSFAG